MDLSSEDAATRKKGVAFLQDVARAMKHMDGTVMAGVNYSSWPRKLLPGELVEAKDVVDVADASRGRFDGDIGNWHLLRIAA
jgi:hypothetical protein